MILLSRSALPPAADSNFYEFDLPGFACQVVVRAAADFQFRVDDGPWCCVKAWAADLPSPVPFDKNPRTISFPVSSSARKIVTTADLTVAVLPPGATLQEHLDFGFVNSDGQNVPVLLCNDQYIPVAGPRIQAAFGPAQLTVATPGDKGVGTWWIGRDGLLSLTFSAANHAIDVMSADTVYRGAQFEVGSLRSAGTGSLTVTMGLVGQDGAGTRFLARTMPLGAASSSAHAVATFGFGSYSYDATNGLFSSPGMPSAVAFGITVSTANATPSSIRLVSHWLP